MLKQVNNIVWLINSFNIMHIFEIFIYLQKRKKEKRKNQLSLKHEKSEINSLGGEKFVAVVGINTQTDVVSLELIGVELEWVDAYIDRHFAEGPSHDAEFHVEIRLIARQFRLEYQLEADEAVRGQIRALHVVVDARFQDPLVEEGCEAVCLEVQFRSDLVRFVLFELQIFSKTYVKWSLKRLDFDLYVKNYVLK